jgi:hypothetical protein
MSHAFGRAGEDGKNNTGIGRQTDAIVDRRELEVRTGGVRSRKRRKGRDDHRGVNIFLEVNDGIFAAFRTVKLNFIVPAKIEILQHVHGTAFLASRLHEMKLPRCGGDVAPVGFFCRKSNDEIK